MFNEREKKELHDILSQLKEIGLISDDSTLKNFLNYVENLLLNSLDCTILEAEYRDSVLVLKFLYLYFLSNVKALEDFLDEKGNKIENIDVLVTISCEISNYIKAIVLLDKKDMKVQALTLVRPLIETTWIFMYIVNDENARNKFTDKNIKSKKKWRDFFNARALKQQITNFENETDLPSNIKEMLRSNRNDMYSETSNFVHFDYVSIQKVRINPLKKKKKILSKEIIDDLIVALICAMVYVEFCLIKKKD